MHLLMAAADICHCHHALVRGCVGQHGLAVDIADGVDIGHVGTQAEVGLDGIPVKFQANALCVQGVRPTAISTAPASSCSWAPLYS